jgi:hypothetical protein
MSRWVASVRLARPLREAIWQVDARSVRRSYARQWALTANLKWLTPEY